MDEFKFNSKRFDCPIVLFLDLIGGKWKSLILWNLKDGTKRYGEIRKLLKEVTPKMLTQQLRELEDDGIIMRKVYAEVPPKVEYTLTELGESIMQVVWEMRNWGLKYHVQKEL
ncbi:MAG: winged helix-turn-helix transcriptional regulator [Bacteroidales bacterium]